MFNFKKVTAVAAAFALSLSAVAFVGCGGNTSGGNASQTQSDDVFVGTWTWSGIEVNGQTMNATEYAAYVSEQSGQEVTPDVFTSVSYTFEGDGKGKGLLMGAEVEFTYTVSGDAATVSVNGTNATFNYDASKNVITTTDANTGFTSTFSK